MISIFWKRFGATAGMAACWRSAAAMKEYLPALHELLIPAMADAEDVDLLIPFIAAPQMFAFEASLVRGLSPDSPNVSGTVNRVVQGVRIHAAG